MIHRPILLFALLAGCVVPPPPTALEGSIDREMGKASERKPQPAPQLEQALLPPLRMEMPQVAGTPIDPRFDLSVSNAPAAQVFNSLVSGTRYSMLVHPNVTGSISVNLKDVTIREALDSIRDIYGYEYKIDGTRIFVQPAGIQTRVFQVNYLSSQRRGVSQLRVTSNTSSETGGAGTSGTAGTTGSGGTPASSGGGSGGGTAGTGLLGGAGSTGRESARIVTNQEATFWSDLCEALVALTFPEVTAAAVTAGGQQEDRQRSICNRRHMQSDRSVVVSPHSGVVVVRATAAELRSVENYLRASRLAVERQVMLEAKIIEVTLSNEHQSGINWAIFANRRFSAGLVGQGTVLQNSGPLGTGGSVTFPPPLVTNPAFTVLSPGQNIANATIGGSVFGLALQTPSFASLLTFLETQGNVQVLSSPRVAALNNQKAVLKVGDEQMFVTRLTVTPGTPGGAGVAATPATVSPELTSFFSGIVLDVTPQIDEEGMIALHIYPSINSVSQVDVVVNAGAAGIVNIPTARSTTRQTDTIVRVPDGNIVAIGGLMRTEVNDVRSGLPGFMDTMFGWLFRSTTRITEKKELVILIKPTIVDSDRAWAEDLRQTRGRLDALGRQMGEK